MVEGGQVSYISSMIITFDRCTTVRMSTFASASGGVCIECELDILLVYGKGSHCVAMDLSMVGEIILIADVFLVMGLSD